MCAEVEDEEEVEVKERWRGRRRANSKSHLHPYPFVHVSNFINKQFIIIEQYGNGFTVYIPSHIKARMCGKVVVFVTCCFVDIEPTVTFFIPLSPFAGVAVYF